MTQFSASFARTASALLLSLVAVPALAMDFLEAAPKQSKVLIDNDKVRIIEVKMSKGDKIPMHTHPAAVVYVIKAGKVRWTAEDGKVSETQGKDGDTLYRPAVTHAHEHLEASHAILVELKK
ncbi:MAG: cupin domain-containing protein [Burkholderiales bacterium]|jgi:quercetin dioxygenase-like cupin family protein|nr:cupin domain-containing protein [Burkholderiales bacterium]